MLIAEVSKKLDISIQTLRYYERMGLIPPVNRDHNGVRNYTERDCDWVCFIKCMRKAGISIEVLIEYVTMFQQGNHTVKTRKNLLIKEYYKLSERIEEMKEIQERLSSKIEGYEDRMEKYEEKLK